jgi:hypothetical protein
MTRLEPYWSHARARLVEDSGLAGALLSVRDLLIVYASNLQDEEARKGSRAAIIRVGGDTKLSATRFERLDYIVDH